MRKPSGTRGLTGQEVQAKIDRMPVIDKVATLSGYQGIWQGLAAIYRRNEYHRSPVLVAECAPGDVDGMKFANGPRGVVLEGGATTFPVSVARAATWNSELEEQIGDAIGKELRALGGTFFGGVCVNLLRNPSWGRAQDTYGEDPVLAGDMGAALVRGVQRHALAAVKYFAAHSLERAKFSVDVRVSERALHELYLPQFKRCVDAGVAAVMVAHNSVNGSWCSQNSMLITDTLRTRWGFDGFVVSDFAFGIRDPQAALEAGLDLEMPYKMMWGLDVNRLIDDGKVSESRIDASLERLIRPQYDVPAADAYHDGMVGADAHRALAREAAAQSMVLLQNNAGLPLEPTARVAVLGRLADVANLGDRGTSDTRPDGVVTLLAGLRSASRSESGGEVSYHDTMHTAEAQSAVADADAVVVVVGCTHEDEGEWLDPAALLPQLVERLGPPAKLRPQFAHPFARRSWSAAASLVGTGLGRLPRAFLQRAVARGDQPFGDGGDRDTLELSAEDHALIRSACSSNERVIVVVMGASAIIMERWRELPAAIVMAWYPGAEGGHALADLVYGNRSPSGRLPFAIPVDAADVAPFDTEASSVTYDLWHGYRKLHRDARSAAFSFGFGLSYSTFEYRAMRCSNSDIAAGASITIEVDVANTGSVDADEVVQIYAEVEESAYIRVRTELVAFGRFTIAAGQVRTCTIELPADRLCVYDESLSELIVEPVAYQLRAAQHVDDRNGPSVTLRAR